MLFDIEPKGPVAIYEQIVAQVIYGVASGALEPGLLIPSVRELAQNLGINPNTVARAFECLERDGILTARRGLGMEVAAGAPALCRARRQELVRERIRAALREAASSALTPDQIRKIVDEELARVNGKRPREKA
jgi:GntR family transcriptional regulator